MSTARRRNSTDGVPSAATVVLLAALWVVSHSYRGLYHDGILYAGQALLHLRPSVYSGDLFFVFGSQDDYSIFGRAYAAVIDRLGLVWGPRWAWALSQSIWCLVAVLWLRLLVPARHLLPTAAALFAVSSFYSNSALLRMAEPFVTARSFAEPLTLGAVLAFVHGRWVVGSGVLIVAGLIHPIMALPGALVSGVLWVLRAGVSTRRLLLPALAAGATALSLLFLIGDLGQVDEQWYGLLLRYSAMALPDVWLVEDWTRMLVPPVLLTLAGRVDRSRWAVVWNVFAACAFIGLGLTIAAWLTRWELGLQVQFWRFGWIAAWAAPLAAVQLALAMPRGAFPTRLALFTVVPVIALSGQPWWPAGWVLPMVHTAFLAFLVASGCPDSPLLRRLAVILASVIFVFSIVGAGAAVTVAAWGGSSWSFHETAVWPTLFDYGGWAILPVVVLGLIAAADKWAIGLSRGVVAALAMALAIALADGRSDAVKEVDRLIDDGLPEWSSLIPESATVFWPERLPYVWFAIGRRSYVSRVQTSGVAFKRETAMEGARRMRQVDAIGRSDAQFPVPGVGPLSEWPAPDRIGLEKACSDPLLDFVVLDREIGPRLAPPFVEQLTGQAFFLHRCEDLRPGVTPVSPAQPGGR